MTSRIQLRKNLGRVLFPCSAGNKSCIALFDPGSPNTIITLELAKSLGLRSAGEQTAIKLMGGTIPAVPVVLPEMTFGEIAIPEVRVLAGLDTKTWQKTIILGLNVLNYFRYGVDRETDPGHISLMLTNRPAPRSSKRSRFNHLLSNSGYYITDETTVPQ